MKFETPGYLKEIEDVGWIQEVIMERFDNALEFMSPNSVIYGGAVRDCLANKELIGDLDFAVTPDDFESISGAFHTNPKWIPSNPCRGEELKSSDYSVDEVDEGIEVAQPILKLKVKSSGDLASKFSPMSSVSSFETTGGKTVQLITSKYQDRDPLQSAIYVARMVDIVCCGVVMLSDGRVFEAVPGAYQDCIDGVLRINKCSDTIYLDALGFRVEKLIGRGWKNTIDVNKVIRGIEEEREKAKKRELRLIELRNKRTALPPIEGLKEYNFLYNKSDKTPISGGYMQEVTKYQIDSMFSGNPIECVRTLEAIASNIHVNVRVKQTPIGNVYYELANGEQAYRFQRRLQQFYDTRTTKPRPRFEPSFKKSSAVKMENPFSMPTSGTTTGRTDTSTTAIGGGGGGGGGPIKVYLTSSTTSTSFSY